MAIAGDWYVTLKVTVQLQSKFGDTSSVPSAPGTAKRTNAMFLIACVVQLITIIVMLTRAMPNTVFVALSVHTPLL
jgi:hypothetical protein